MSDPLVNPSAERYIPVAKPSTGEAEMAAVARSLENNQLSQSYAVERFEREFAEAHGKKYGVTCNSGTSALLLALVAAGVGKGDEVICPTLTMIAVANAILAAGARPVFVDSEPRTGNIDLDSDLPLPTDSYRDVVAMILPHLYGMPIEFPRQKSPRGTIIEDAAESHYATFPDGSPVGSRGDFACFSFFANKIITTMGEGGIVLTDDPQAAERLRGLRAHAFDPAEHFNHQEHAWGMRMTNPQAAFGLAQHGRREEFLARRRQIWMRYAERLHELAWVEFPLRAVGSADWVFPLLVRDGPGSISRDSAITRDHVRAALAEKGVESRTYFKPMHQQKHLSRFAAGQSFPVADDLSRRGLYLPLHVSMTDQDVDYITEILSGLRP